ncbi:MAG: hypothetical protein HQ519_00070 [Planctomycetes bacterium]|nr:hypothetical protein [Planctomycetota bacterium]
MTRSFRSFALDDTNGITPGNLNDEPPIDGKRVSLIGDGDAFQRVRRGGRRVKMGGTVIGSTATELKTRLRDLMAVLQNPTKGLLILDTYELSCWSRPGRIVYDSPMESALSAQWSCSFESEDPFWTDPTSGVSSSTVNNNSVSEQTFNILYGSDLAETYPLFEIKQLAAVLTTGFEVTLVNDDTGAEFRLLDFDLGQNDVLSVDPYTEQVWISSDVSGNAVTPRRVDGVFWPVNGANFDLIVRHNQQGSSPNFQVKTILYKRHYTFNA